MKRLPAEWEKQSFLQFTFPHAKSDWNYLLKEVTACFIEMIGAASQFQKVLVVCDDTKRVRPLFQHNSRVYFAEIESDDTWARDHGGITVMEQGKPVILDYIFNGWGNKFSAAADNHITRNLCAKGILGNASIKQRDFVLEGGSIESDGMGTILTTAQCLLEKNRNPRFSQSEIETILRADLGANRVLWLNHGYLAGDDTDSHIDTLARFCNAATIAFTGCRNSGDEHFEELQKMKFELQNMVDYQGNPYNLVELPLPTPCYDTDGNRLPATYANFTIINGAVLVPVYGVKEDEEALESLRNCFSGRKIVAINCRTLIEQHGSLHCVTMQYPESVVLAGKAQNKAD